MDLVKQQASNLMTAAAAFVGAVLGVVIVVWWMN